jgi:hypothetical protein
MYVGDKLQHQAQRTEYTEVLFDSYSVYSAVLISCRLGATRTKEYSELR